MFRKAREEMHKKLNEDGASYRNHQNFSGTHPRSFVGQDSSASYQNME